MLLSNHIFFFKVKWLAAEVQSNSETKWPRQMSHDTYFHQWRFEVNNQDKGSP